MNGPTPRSVQFRREREQGWRELERLVERVEKRGPRVLTPTEMMRLPMLYRAAVSSLSVARAISLDRSLLNYLEALCARAYLCVYGVRDGVGRVLVQFFARDFPQGVRALRRQLLLATIVMVLGALTGFLMTSSDPARYSAFVPVGLQEGRGPLSSAEELREILYAGEDSDEGELWFFSSFLVQHNAGIGIGAFALGVLFGVPVVYLMFSTGLMIGAMGALHHAQGLGFSWWGWVLPHGVTELWAVILCGAAGLAVGQALISPGARTRVHAVAARSREVSGVVLGAVVLFFIAGLLEGLFRQKVQSDLVRYTVTIGSTLVWTWYFLRVGRGRP